MKQPTDREKLISIIQELINSVPAPIARQLYAGAVDDLLKKIFDDQEKK